MAPTSGSYRHHHSETSISSYFTPNRLHHSSSAGSGSSSPSTRRAPHHYHRSLHSATGEAALQQDRNRMGRLGRGLQNNDLSVPGGLLPKNLPTLIPHQPTIINHLFYLNLRLQDFSVGLCEASPGAMHLRFEVQIQY